MSEEEIDYVVSAIEYVAAHGWKYLPEYRYISPFPYPYPSHLSMSLFAYF
jgi:hypothetical protein